jgi:glycosyltransferase involved in cell wall biosynthesis
LALQWSARFPFLQSVTVLPLIMERANRFDFGLRVPTLSDQTVFGFAARVEAGKGPMDLLDALAIVNQDQPLAVVRIAGTGPQLAEVKARARELALDDTCEFVGHYTEPLGRTAFMESLDVFVLPSFAEGTPNGVIEAMAHGVPIIASTVGGIPDIVDADSGILLPAGDAEALAQAMSLLALDPQRRKQMGAAARRRYEELFEPAVVVPLMLEVYGRLAGNGHLATAVTSGNGHSHPWSQTEIKAAPPTFLTPAVVPTSA